MTKPVNKIAPHNFTKKGSYYHQGKYQQQEADKDQKGINGKGDLHDPVNMVHGLCGECKNMPFKTII